MMCGRGECVGVCEDVLREVELVGCLLMALNYQCTSVYEHARQRN
jgi:hypothetical protein